MGLSSIQYINDLKALGELVLSNWYIILPFSVFLLFFSNFVEFLSLCFIGFLVGFSYISPILYTFIEKYLPNAFAVVSKNEIIFSISISIIFAVIFYGLYKSIIFLGSFFIGFFAVNFIVNSFAQTYVSLPWYAYVVIGAIVGLVAGFYATKNSAKFIGFLSMLLGSFFVALTLTTLFNRYVIKLNEMVFSYTAFIIALVVFLVRVRKL
ncbi:hypothetical protein MNL76_05855 [Fervidobacterium riparium]|nr:hypothetical protein IB67_07825 [Fervidobacterium riparium]